MLNWPLICMLFAGSIQAYSPFFNGSCLSSFLSVSFTARTLKEKQLDKIISNSAKNILSQARNFQMRLNIGRKSLVLLMEKEPAQISVDLPRIPSISVGGIAVGHDLKKKDVSMNQFETIAKAVETYVKKQRPAFIKPGTAGQIGPFALPR